MILNDFAGASANWVNANVKFGDTVELIMGIEDEFGVSIEMSSDFKTVGSVVKYIEDNMN